MVCVAGIHAPPAATIKTALLIELFTRHADKLDDLVPGADKVLKDDAHPAYTHFEPKSAQRDPQRPGRPQRSPPWPDDDRPVLGVA